RPPPPQATLLPYTTLFRSQGRAIREVPLHRLLGRKRGTGNTCQPDDLHAELEHQLLHIFRTFALEQSNSFFDLKRSSHGVTQRLDRKSTRLNSSHQIISYA